MMCEYCNMTPHKNGSTEWLQGEEYGDEFSEAHIEHDSKYGWMLLISYYDGLRDETQTLGVSIVYCPWCGSELGRDE